MMEGTPNKLDQVTIDEFLGSTYERKSFEVPIAAAIPRYCAAFGIDLDQIREKPVSWILDRDHKTFHGFRNGFTPDDVKGAEYIGNLDYTIGLNMGVALRVQETLKRE